MQTRINASVFTRNLGKPVRLEPECKAVQQNGAHLLFGDTNLLSFTAYYQATELVNLCYRK